MKTNYFKLLMVCALLFSGTLVSANMPTKQDPKKENRNVGVYSGITLSVPADLYLAQGDKNELIIEGDADILEKVITEMEGSVLNIRFENWYNNSGNKRITIYATTKDIDKISVTGSGKVISKTPISTSEFDLLVTGSGSIIIDNLTAKSVESTITGSGSILLSGGSKISSLEAEITGSGDFKSENIDFVNADIDITGSGSLHVYVSDKLVANITGSGKVCYKGKPVINADITGSGKIVNEN